MKKLLTVLAISLGSAGCATLDGPTLRSGASAGLEAAKFAAPHQAENIARLQKLLGGAKESMDAITLAEAQGFSYERVWYVDGEVKPASSIHFVDLLRRSSRPSDNAAATVSDTAKGEVYRKTLDDALKLLDAIEAGEAAGDE